MKSYQKLGLIVLAALALRLFCLTFVQHPGISDPNHYYNLGVRLTEGYGFTIDYIWHYKQPPAAVVHPDDYWMPLTGILAAIPMSLFGVSVDHALILFIIIGSLVPVVTYAIAREFECSETSSLFAAAASAVVPELVLNSVRTDTTIVNVLLVCTSVYLMTRGLKRGGIWNFLGGGVAGGLAYLTRNDSSLLLPVFALTFLVYWYWGNRRQSLLRLGAYTALTVVVALLVAFPWLVRNQQVLGAIAPPGSSSMFFYVNVKEDFAYNRQFTLQTMLASQTIPELIAKRLFELLAAFKLAYTTLDVFLPVAVFGGLILLVAARDRQRLLTFAPTLIWIIAIFIAYPILIPIKSQAGSFKKAYLTIIPLLLPLAAYALDRAIAENRLRIGVMLLAVLFTGANAVELVRADARATNTYLGNMEGVVKVAQTLPDTNGDGHIILMVQDPFMLGFLGMSSVLLPDEDRATILQIAQRYGVDYLLMPADRDSLDPIYYGEETDPHFFHVADVPKTTYQFYGFKFDAG